MKKFLKVLGITLVSLAIIVFFFNKDRFKSSASSTTVTKNIKISMFDKIDNIKK